MRFRLPFSTLIQFAGVPSAALYPPAMSYPFYQPVIQPMVNIKLQLKSNPTPHRKTLLHLFFLLSPVKFSLAFKLNLNLLSPRFVVAFSSRTNTHTSTRMYQQFGLRITKVNKYEFIFCASVSAKSSASSALLRGWSKSLVENRRKKGEQFPFSG